MGEGEEEEIKEDPLCPADIPPPQPIMGRTMRGVRIEGGDVIAENGDY